MKKFSSRSKIFFVMPDIEIGGAQKVMLYLFKNIDKKKYNCWLVILTSKGCHDLSSEPNVIVINSQKISKSFLPFYFHYRKIRPDIIFSTIFYVNIFVLICKLIFASRSKIIIREANHPFRSSKNNFLLTLKKIFYRLYFLSDYFIVQTTEIKKSFLDFAPNFKSRIYIIKNPVEINPRLQIEKTNRINFQEKFSFKILMVGRLTRQKNHLEAIWLMKNLPSFVTLDIYGDGVEKKILQEQIDNLNLHQRVKMHGLSRNLEKVYADSDLLLLTSLWEGLPNVALEALSCGLHVLGSTTSGLCELSNEVPNSVRIYSSGENLVSMISEFVDIKRKYGSLPSSTLPSDYSGSAVLKSYERLFDNLS